MFQASLGSGRSTLIDPCTAIYEQDYTGTEGGDAHSVDAVVPGHLFLHSLDDDFWLDFWKFYQEQWREIPRNGELASAAIKRKNPKTSSVVL